MVNLSAHTYADNDTKTVCVEPARADTHTHKHTNHHHGMKYDR